jgi:hypothetical protein
MYFGSLALINQLHFLARMLGVFGPERRILDQLEGAAASLIRYKIFP